MATKSTIASETSAKKAPPALSTKPSLANKPAKPPAILKKPDLASRPSSVSVVKGCLSERGGSDSKNETRGCGAEVKREDLRTKVESIEKNDSKGTLKAEPGSNKKPFVKIPQKHKVGTNDKRDSYVNYRENTLPDTSKSPTTTSSNERTSLVVEKIKQIATKNNQNLETEISQFKPLGRPSSTLHGTLKEQASKNAGKQILENDAVKTFSGNSLKKSCSSVGSSSSFNDNACQNNKSRYNDRTSSATNKNPCLHEDDSEKETPIKSTKVHKTTTENAQNSTTRNKSINTTIRKKTPNPPSSYPNNQPLPPNHFISTTNGLTYRRLEQEQVTSRAPRKPARPPVVNLKNFIGTDDPKDQSGDPFEFEEATWHESSKHSSLIKEEDEEEEEDRLKKMEEECEEGSQETYEVLNDEVYDMI